MKHIVIEMSTLSMCSSCRRAEKKPSSANFDEEYGARYGCGILPDKQIYIRNQSKTLNIRMMHSSVFDD